jgi:hypothetical protein
MEQQQWLDAMQEPARHELQSELHFVVCKHLRSLLWGPSHRDSYVAQRYVYVCVYVCVCVCE